MPGVVPDRELHARETQMNRANRDLTPAAALISPLQGRALPIEGCSTEDRGRALFLGVAICSLFPALFWCGVIWFIAPLAGLHPSAPGLAAIGSTIALFLIIISSAILARGARPEAGSPASTSPAAFLIEVACIMP